MDHDDKTCKNKLYFYIVLDAITVSSLSTSSLENLQKFKGHLKSVKHVPELGSDFVLLEGEADSRICSLLLPSKTKESGAELKVVLHQD